MLESKVTRFEDYRISKAPYYEPVGNEVLLFQMAYENKRPVSLRGPTGCGKTTLTEFMAYTLGLDITAFPYIEVPCHEDITETHLLGRYDLDGKWLPGPLYIGAKYGGMVVLDEFIESRPDVRVLTHSVTDDRRVLSVSKTGEVIQLPDNFMLVTCYNPGYQIKSKVLKPSTAQRYITIDMGYPSQEIEVKILMKKTGIEKEIAVKFVRFANDVRNMRDSDRIRIQEGVSTRLLVMVCELYKSYIRHKLSPNLKTIAKVALINPITSEQTDKKVLEELLAIF
ncbi:AAA family ATPase [Candidatus Woesearchaeota archaeon]|nr:AAA family ATPase [Candidatus Woesearchaeota archaeon]